MTKSSPKNLYAHSQNLKPTFVSSLSFLLSPSPMMVCVSFDSRIYGCISDLTCGGDRLSLSSSPTGVLFSLRTASFDAHCGARCREQPYLPPRGASSYKTKIYYSRGRNMVPYSIESKKILLLPYLHTSSLSNYLAMWCYILATRKLERAQNDDSSHLGTSARINATMIFISSRELNRGVP